LDASFRTGVKSRGRRRPASAASQEGKNIFSALLTYREERKEEREG
jgi:hypothetical protein